MRTGTSNRVSDGLVTLKVADGDGYMVIAPIDCFAAMLAAATAFKWADGVKSRGVKLGRPTS